MKWLIAFSFLSLTAVCVKAQQAGLHFSPEMTGPKPSFDIGFPSIGGAISKPLPFQQSKPLAKSLAHPAAFCLPGLAFFCKLEVQLEKASKMPVKFRIGEVQYVERMEGKY